MSESRSNRAAFVRVVTMIGLALKILFRLAFHIQYIVRIPWIDANV